MNFKPIPGEKDAGRERRFGRRMTQIVTDVSEIRPLRLDLRRLLQRLVQAEMRRVPLAALATDSDARAMVDRIMERMDGCTHLSVAKFNSAI